jgi:hypothetical protein
LVDSDIRFYFLLEIQFLHALARIRDSLPMKVDPGHELYAKLAAYSRESVLGISDAMRGGVQKWRKSALIWPFGLKRGVLCRLPPDSYRGGNRQQIPARFQNL